MYHYFTSEYPLPKEPEDLESPSTPASASPTIKRHVPAEVIQLQVDEVVTKSQETGTQNQQNLHPTVEDGSGRTEYLVAKTSSTLQLLVGVVLALLGLFRGKRLVMEPFGLAIGFGNCPV